MRSLVPVLLLFTYVTANLVTISNKLPRRDVDGNILEVSDGSLLEHDGLFYLYGVKYQPCPVSEQPKCYNPCGYFNMTFAVYVSPDLVEWKLGSENVLPVMAPEGNGTLSSRHVTYFEPGVMYNPRTSKFVMWFMMYFKEHAVAVSDSPLGPFEIVTMPGHAGMSVNGSGTYVWMDRDTGDAYIKHNHIIRHQDRGPAQYVSKLSWDFTHAVETAPVAWDCQPPAVSHPPGANSPCFQEGGGMFEYDGVWYVMGGDGCCFCSEGGDSKVWRSKTGPMGPYTYIGNANNFVVAAQQFGIYPISTKAGTVPLYVGLRWGSAPNGKKNNDFQYWYPLHVNTTSDTITPIRWVDSFTLDLP